MAAYAALISLMHIIDQIEHHPHPPISPDKEQVQSLTEKVTFLQEFIEDYSHVDYSKEADALESRIANAAYAAEDIIESHIVDQILAGSTSHGKHISSGEELSASEETRAGKAADGSDSHIADAEYEAEDVIESHLDYQIAGGSTSHGEKMCCIDFYEGLQKVIEDMDSIKKEVIRQKRRKIKREVKDILESTGIQDQLNKKSTPAGSLKSPSTGQNTMIGFDDSFKEIKDKLIGRELDRQIIPIFGMGGIGKTTLAKNIYADQLIVRHFDILTWATISQSYNMQEILLEIICQENKNSRGSLSEHELGEMLHKHLSGRRYLIVMDDIWDIEVWHQLRFFFPDNKNGSRILITTRQANVAFRLTETHCFKMNPLDEDNSWDLLCKTAFAEVGCPPELEEIGKKIAKNCKGLPLSIVVIGRVLARSRQTQEYWEYIAENLSSIVNLEDDEHCLKILSTSYNQLPVHLKPCFLYMSVFREVHMIDVPLLIRLWVAEGFLKPARDQSLEAIAEEYVKDLVDRNLIFVHKWGSNGKIEICNIHDLLRDLCLRKAKKENFLCVARQHNLDIPQGTNMQRRVAFHGSTSGQSLQSLQCASLVRSLICDFELDLPSVNFRLLRVLQALNTNIYLKKSRSVHSVEAILFQLINSRYLAISIRSQSLDSYVFPSSLYLLWNLHTLIVHNNIMCIAPCEIWKMTQLRHVEFWYLKLPDPPSGYTDGRDDIVLENLHALLGIDNFKCSKEVVKRIPHIKELKVLYCGLDGWSLSCFKNLDLLKLESLYLFFETGNGINWSDVVENVSFPRSLKKLTLIGCLLPWEDITTKIGSLPLLEVLELKYESTKGAKWETVEGGFPSLKFLRIGFLNNDLECWTMTDCTHFPVLEHLVLSSLNKLESIPSELGNIPTLKLIELWRCSDSAVISAKEMLDEQELEYGNLDIQVRVRLSKENAELQSLAGGNFKVEAVGRH